MRNRILWSTILLLGVLVATGLGTRDAAPASANTTQWDYGILRMDMLTWCERGRIVEQKPPADFAEALGIPYSRDANIFEINVLNGLGDQGWELVTMPKGAIYVFKRPR
jgi:hypothetical protein